MLTVDETRKALGKDYPGIVSLTDKEIEQIRDQIYNFWSLMLENEGL
ncbi:MAG: hypothetical protein PHH98_00225 [Candidatus Gracilibacteria bacterium]|nr:hypothetical protein [Candidatus Gracilibacteria bacterium]